jgi:hypothetical protein
MKHCRILQPISPQLIPTNSQFLPGAKAGDILVVDQDVTIYDPETNEPIGKLSTVVDQITLENVTPSELYIEWQPRSKGGGLAKNHGDNRSCLENCTPVPGRNAQWTKPDGNEIVGYVVFTGKNGFVVQLTGMAFEQLVMDSEELEAGETYILGTTKYAKGDIAWYGFKVIK